MSFVTFVNQIEQICVQNQSHICNLVSPTRQKREGAAKLEHIL